MLIHDEMMSGSEIGLRRFLFDNSLKFIREYHKNYLMNEA